MLKEIQYKTFSWNTHQKNWQIKRLNTCQFELTFGCGLHCRHCYSDCYNHHDYIRKELNTRQVKILLDKAYDAGVIWMCFTGGDPLTRGDFLEIYTYARNKGFIVTIFTNAYSMTREIADYLKKRPPFVIEMTLNAVTEEVYEKISQIKGSFKKVMQGIDLILEAKIPVKIKTQVTKDNFAEMPKIKEFLGGLGLEFRPSSILHARLNSDTFPCNLRVEPERILGADEKKDLQNDDCFSFGPEPTSSSATNIVSNPNLFRCTIGGGDGFNIDPYGNTFPCSNIRKPAYNLLEVDIGYALNELLSLVRNRKFSTDSKCRDCSLIDICYLCPGKAFLETGDMEAPVPYYCELAKGNAKLLNC